MGSDSREGLTAAQRKEYATGNAAGRRTDSIILVHVSQSGGKPALISIPADSYVPIPGHGSNKINAAFAFGGPNLLVQTVEQVTDLHIDGYVEIGFAGFASVVDSVGRRQHLRAVPMNDKKAGINLKKGCQVLDGKNALGFVRARYSDPRGDIGRAERQRQFLAAIMKKAATPSTVLVPTRYWGFTHASAKGLIVGEDTSMRDASRVLLAMRAVSNDNGPQPRRPDPERELPDVGRQLGQVEHPARQGAVHHAAQRRAPRGAAGRHRRQAHRRLTLTPLSGLGRKVRFTREPFRGRSATLPPARYAAWAAHLAVTPGVDVPSRPAGPGWCPRRSG